jgi:tetratricopeptide (TPR) repeat protein
VVLGRLEEALQDLERARELEPNHGPDLLACAHLKKGVERFEEALLDHADRLKPDDVETLKYRAYTKMELGKLEEALRDVNRAHELEPDNEFILLVREEIERRLGMYDEDLQDLDRAEGLETGSLSSLAEP